jgi:hypothetical protein
VTIVAAARESAVPDVLRRHLCSVLLGMAGLALAACGGGEDRSKAQVRLVNASIDHAALDLFDDEGRRLRAGVAFGGDAGYAEVDPADADFDVTRAGSTAPLSSLSASLNEGDRYSLVSYANAGGLNTVLIDDNVGDPDSGKVMVRVLNAAPDAGDLDVYLTAAGVALDDAEPLLAGAQAGTSTALATTDAASWRLRVTAAGDRDDLRLDIPALTLGSRQVVTLVITSGAGGVLVDAIVLVQRGAIGVQRGSTARVRVVAGVTDSGAVAATAGGVTLLGGIGAPAAGPYRLVPAGAAAATASVDGAPVTVPATDLAAGRDYTLLVFGLADAARAAWIPDDNRRPTVSGRARLRLVHGVADLDDPIALTLDFDPVADGVLPGSASTPVPLSAVSAGALSVTAPGRGSPLWGAVDQVLEASGVYTLFIVGREAAPTGILRKDR